MSARGIRCVLVANRGEIAVRVIRACREAGIGTVAVCSEADRGALHAELADRCEFIGGAEPTASYLRAEAVVQAALRTGADAVHPGYGFLAENADFARACNEAGLVFIGPSPETIAGMGEKTAARRIMAAAGVPVVPGATLPAPDGDGRFDEAALAAAGDEVGYPLLVKAAFGGGGKGMRLVEDPADLAAACGAAVREATGAFGDGTIYLERYLARPRHIEFQVFGDSHGNCVHLFERECSVQRRHQKIVEESPSPALDDDLRRRMGEAAVAAARAVDYVGAGTVEFLLADGGFHFLEMNTRLQVEHPVTEMVTGTDLVRAQLDVAAGGRLPWSQEELHQLGHAFECRVYAEDPADDFMPSLGDLLLVSEPAGPGVRVDSGVRQGDEVTLHYDPMLAKLVVHGPDREAARQRTLAALRDYAVLGVTTNIPYLQAILQDDEFVAGRLHTGILDERLPGWRDDGGAPPWVVAAAAAAGPGSAAAALPGAAASGPVEGPWQALGRFRLAGLDGGKGGTP